MLSNIFFFIPFMYRFHTRKSGRFTVIPFLLTDFLPPLVFLSNAETICTFSILIIYLLSYLAMFSCYELGYIVNDSITILHEKNPTLRLNDTELAYFYRNGVLIVGFRLFLVLLCCIILRYELLVSVEKLLFGCLFVLVAYCINNYYAFN